MLLRGGGILPIIGPAELLFRSRGRRERGEGID